MRRTKKFGTCVLCGNVDELTRDHIPPKTIFPRPRPSDLITVPCCFPCNNSAKKDDEYFGVMMALRDKDGHHDSSKKLLQKIFNGLEHEKATGFKRKVFRNFSFLNIVTNTGIILGKHPVFEEESEPIIRVIERTCKGLFYHEYKKRYPDSYKIKVCFGNSLMDSGFQVQNNMIKSVEAALTATPKEIGNGEFKYWLKHAKDDNNTFIMLYEVFKSHYFLCFSIPQEYINN